MSHAARAIPPPTISSGCGNIASVATMHVLLGGHLPVARSPEVLTPRTPNSRGQGHAVRAGGTCQSTTANLCRNPCGVSSIGAPGGLLQPGKAADVTVFDPDALADRSTWENGRMAPAGIEHVLVNGQTVVASGRATGALPGRIVGRS